MNALRLDSTESLNHSQSDPSLGKGVSDLVRTIVESRSNAAIAIFLVPGRIRGSGFVVVKTSNVLCRCFHRNDGVVKEMPVLESDDVGAIWPVTLRLAAVAVLDCLCFCDDLEATLSVRDRLDLGSIEELFANATELSDNFFFSTFLALIEAGLVFKAVFLEPLSCSGDDDDLVNKDGVFGDSVNPLGLRLVALTGW